MVIISSQKVPDYPFCAVHLLHFYAKAMPVTYLAKNRSAPLAPFGIITGNAGGYDVFRKYYVNFLPL
jgi:hypothetical protein